MTKTCPRCDSPRKDHLYHDCRGFDGAHEWHSPRTTQAHNRYQICDPTCGLVETATSLKNALAIASKHTCPGVEVFDTMARKDCIQTWDATGKILNFRRG